MHRAQNFAHTASDALTARLAKSDAKLKAVHGDLNTTTLVEGFREWLLLSTSVGSRDELTAHGQKLLQKHDRLGSMIEEQNFVLVAQHLRSALAADYLDIDVAIEMQRRFEATQSLLHAAKKHLEEQHTSMKSSNNSFARGLGKKLGSLKNITASAA